MKVSLSPLTSITGIVRRVSKLFPVMSEHKGCISLFFFFFLLSENTKVPHPMLGRTSAADTAVHFCCRAALSLLWQHEKQGPGLDQGHVVVHSGKGKVITRDRGELFFMFLYHQLSEILGTNVLPPA